MLFLIWPLIFWHISSAHGKAIPRNEFCVTAIETAYGYISFAELASKSRQEYRCQNTLRVLSIYAASEIYCDPSERAAGFSQIQSQCQASGLDLIPRERFAINLTDDAINHMHVVEFREIPKKERVNKPVLISKPYFDRVVRSINTWEFELWSHYTFGYIGYAYWTAVIILGVVHKLILQTLSSRRVKSSFQSLNRVVSLYHWAQTHLIVPGQPTLFGYRPFWWTFPSRIDAVIASLFWILSIFLCLIGYRTFPENIYWTDISAQILRYAADRTGILSFANIPLLWLFAGRNNILIWATGWSFSTFNLFHRHVAWIATLQAVAHTALYTVLFIQAGNAWKKMQKPYLLWGTLAMAAMLFVFPFAVDLFRRRAYETFLILHVVFSIIALVGCFYHAIIFEDHEFWFYLWPAVAIWAIDRLLRLVRIVYCNLHVQFAASGYVQCTTGRAKYDEAADVIRIELTPGSNLCPRPGQYYYIYQPFRFTGWESHPFTLGAWSYNQDTETSLQPKIADSDASQIPLLSDSEESEYGSISIDKSENSQLTLTFWIRPYNGWTRHLRDQCMQSRTRTISPTMLLEGPYGESIPLWKYESVLLITGGTGIAAAVPYIQRIFQSSPETCSRDVHLVWTTRQPAFINDVATRELKHALRRKEIRASFYVTSSSCDSFAEITGNVEIVQGRPDLQALITMHAHEARLNASSMAVLVCGPSGMASQARAAVHLTLRRGYGPIRYIEESFNW